MWKVSAAQAAAPSRIKLNTTTRRAKKINETVSIAKKEHGRLLDYLLPCVFNQPAIKDVQEKSEINRKKKIKIKKVLIYKTMLYDIF